MTLAALAVVAAVLYGSSLSAGAFPGRPAALIAQGAGLSPRMAPHEPLSWGIQRILGSLPGKNVALWFNLFSVACAVGCVLLAALVVRRVLKCVLAGSTVAAKRQTQAAYVGGIGAALFLAFCVPFWTVANRAHTAAFHLLLLLTTVWMLVHFCQHGGERVAWLVALMCGIGCVEFASFYLFSPLFALVLLLVSWRQGLLSWGSASRLLLFVVLGLLLYLVAASVFQFAPAYEWRGFKNVFHVVSIMLRRQQVLIARSLPKQGWLVALMFTAVPWLIALVVGRRGLHGEKDRSLFFLHVLLTSVALAVLLDFRLAPWPMFGMERLLVTPYLLTATLFGYLTAYWFIVPSSIWEDPQTRMGIYMNRFAGPMFAAVLLLLAACVPFFNFTKADTRGGRFADAWAEETVSALGGRGWLVTTGMLDDNILIAAHNAGHALHIINLRSAGNPVYRQYVASLFERPRLRSLATIGVVPLLQEWLRSDPQASDDIAIAAAPDLWLGAGQTAVPRKTLFAGTAQSADVDVTELLMEHQRFWASIVPLLKEQSQRDSRLAGLAAEVLRYSSLVANNLGVFIEDQGRPDVAHVAYLHAQDLDENNLSALLNLYRLAREGIGDYQPAEIEERLAEVRRKARQQPNVWSLSRHYGYVRDPRIFADLGLGWALSGQPGMAVSGIRRAIELSGERQSAPLLQLLAGVHLQHREDQKSEDIYSELLVEDPQNPTALLGLARISTREGYLDKARAYLARAEAVGAPKKQVALQWAFLYWTAGEVDQARIVLEEIVDLNPDDLIAWSMLISTYLAQDDRDAIEGSMQQLERIEGGQIVIDEIRARLALQESDLEKALSYYLRMLDAVPANMGLRERVAKLSLLTGRSEQALSHARVLLRSDPENAWANYILAAHQIEQGDYELAEDSLRLSIQKVPMAPALNDLAWVLQRRGSFEEAERLARHAIDLEPNLFASWDTLGVILMRQEQYDEAEQSLRHSLSLFQGELSVFLHLAELHYLRGEVDVARDLLSMLQSQNGRLTEEDARRLRELRQEVEEEQESR